MNNGRFSSGAGRTALSGLMTALSTFFLYIAPLVPTNRIAVTAVAGLFPMVALLASGRSAAILCWIGSSVLGFVLAPEKWLVLVYLVFFGPYPIVKSMLESCRKRAFEWIGKVAFFNVVLALLWFGIRSLVFPVLPEFLNSAVLVFLVMNAVFFVYDLGLSQLIAFVCSRFARNTERK